MNETSSASAVVKKVEKEVKGMKIISDESLDQLVLEPYVGSKPSFATSVIKSYSKTPNESISSYMSPILPVLPYGSTSTPCSKQTASVSHPDLNASLNDSVFCCNVKHRSVDFFASSFDDKMGRNINDAAMSTDLFDSRELNCKDNAIIPDNLVLSDMSGIKSVADLSMNMPTSSAVRSKNFSQGLDENASECDLDKLGAHRMNSFEVMSESKEGSSNHETFDKAITSTLRNLRISMPNVNDGSNAQTNSFHSDSCQSEIDIVNRSVMLKHELKDHCSIESSELSLRKCNISHATSTKDVNDLLGTQGLQDCRVLMYRCDDVPASSGNYRIESDTHPVGSTNLMDLNQSQTSMNNYAKHRKSSLTKNISQECVILKPGKHWRRSLSILARGRSSVGETSVNGRKSLSCDDAKTRGKLYESTVSSIHQMQSTIGEFVAPFVMSFPVSSWALLLFSAIWLLYPRLYS